MEITPRKTLSREADVELFDILTDRLNESKKYHNFYYCTHNQNWNYDGNRLSARLRPKRALRRMIQQIILAEAKDLIDRIMEYSEDVLQFEDEPSAEEAQPIGTRHRVGLCI